MKDLGRFAATLAVVLAGPVIWSGLSAAPHYGAWSAPNNVGAPINSPYAEDKATLSKHGLSLYFSSTRPCGDGDAVLDANLWVARRSSPDGDWESAECLHINVNTTTAGAASIIDSAPTLSRDEHWLYFVSDRAGSFGSPGFNGRDIWVSWRPQVHDDTGWQTPTNVGAFVNSAFAEAGPAYFEDDDGTAQLYFTSTRSGVFDIYVADVVDGVGVAPASAVDEVNTAALVEAGVAIRHDGLELFFFRGPSTLFDIFAATRSDPHGTWSEPVNLGAPVNSGANEQAPSISADREQLFFPSNRSGSVLGPNGQPSLDIWFSTRSKHDR